MKTCNTCQISKPFGEYFKDRSALRSSCKDCMRGKQRQRYAADPERQRLIKRKWYDKAAADPKKFREMSERWRANRYGLDSGAFDFMKKEQGGRCACCGDEVDVLVIDHCHKTKRVRGLLCSPCNLALGHLKDSADRARRAAAYLDDKRQS